MYINLCASIYTQMAFTEFFKYVFNYLAVPSLSCPLWIL